MSTITLIIVIAGVAFSAFVAGFFLHAALTVAAASDAWNEGYLAGMEEAGR